MEGMEEMEGMVCVIAGCSDGVIRIYIYDEINKCFELLDTITYHSSHCVLVVQHFLLPHPTPNDGGILTSTVLVSAATDGCIAFWNLSTLLTNWLTIKTPTDVDDKCSHGVTLHEHLLMLSISVHQSGVNDVSVIVLNDSLIGVASVGDDNALVICLCRVSHDGHMTLIEQVKSADAHHSSITGVEYISNTTLLTSSIDQRLCVWSWSYSTAYNDNDTCISLSLHKERDIIHDVIDTTSLLVHKTNSDCTCVLVCGIGIECIELNI
jgi:hypothetical protein